MRVYLSHMVQTSQINTETIEKIFTALKEVKQELKEVKEKLDREPPYGSSAWWDWSDRKAMEEYKAGDYFSLLSAKELDEFFKNIRKNRSNEKYYHRAWKKRREATA